MHEQLPNTENIWRYQNNKDNNYKCMYNKRQMAVSVLENKTSTWSGKMFNSQHKLHYAYVVKNVFQTKRKFEYEQCIVGIKEINNDNPNFYLLFLFFRYIIECSRTNSEFSSYDYIAKK